MRKHAAKKIVRRIEGDPTASLSYGHDQLRRAYRKAGVGNVPDEVWEARKCAQDRHQEREFYKPYVRIAAKQIEEAEDLNFQEEIASWNRMIREGLRVPEEYLTDDPPKEIVVSNLTPEDKEKIRAEVEKMKADPAYSKIVRLEDLPPPDYEGMKVPTLRSLCKARKVAGYSSMTKPKLIAALTAE